jgi:hypothetical protein
MFVREYGYTLVEHDPERPWIVLSMTHQTVTLEAGGSFSEWARETWPAPRWEVEPDPWSFGTTLWPR